MPAVRYAWFSTLNKLFINLQSVTNNALVFFSSGKGQPWEYDLHLWHEEVGVPCIPEDMQM